MCLPIKGGGVLFFHKDSKGQLFVFLGKRNGRRQSFLAHLADRRKENAHNFSKSVFKAILDSYNKGVWSILGGGMEKKDEGDFKVCAYREAIEESMQNPKVEAAIADFKKIQQGKDYFVWYNRLGFCWLTVLIPVHERFSIQLTASEFTRGEWRKIEEFTSELHPYLPRALERLKSLHRS